MQQLELLHRSIGGAAVCLLVYAGFGTGFGVGLLLHGRRSTAIMPGNVHVVIHLLRHGVARVTIGVLVNRVGREQQSAGKDACGKSSSPALPVRIVRSAHGIVFRRYDV